MTATECHPIELDNVKNEIFYAYICEILSVGKNEIMLAL